ncbi:MAG: biopolymer transporter ExbD [Planctomycetia bacterium]|nr:biopolymer transporter ExbD [Planctomycetia bacterium]
MRKKRRAEENVEPNMTPIIDMVFLLLIFFLVATKFADVERDVRVRPPSSEHARAAVDVPQEIVINITKEGTFHVAGVEHRIEDIDNMLAGAVAGNKRQAVVIRGDRRAILQFAVDILDLCQKHNVEYVYITTSKVGT